MAEDKKPTPRRAPAKKSTTSRTRKTAAPKQPEETKPPTEAEELRAKTIQQQRDKVDTYNELKEQGLPIPADLRAEIEATQTPEPVDPMATQRYVRNNNHTMFRFKLAKHTSGQRGIVLQARGTRGDLAPLDPDDLKDPILVANVNNGYVELITHAEAQDIVTKQTTNQQAVHPAMAALRNENGKPYEEGAFKMGPSPDEQAIVVARLEDGQVGFDRTGIRDRVRGEAPGTPEYVSGAEPQHRPANEDPAFLSDLRARTKAHNPAADLKVSVGESVNTGGNRHIISDGFKDSK